MHIVGLFHGTDRSPWFDRAGIHERITCGCGTGGKSRVIGTNPIACSVPNGQGGMAMHFDFSTSAVALGKITMAKYAGEKIPFGWAVDENGNPTDDPEAALKGSLCSAGGYKGWGFGLLAELMASAMTGSVNSLDVGGLKLADGPPHRLGQTISLWIPQPLVINLGNGSKD